MGYSWLLYYSESLDTFIKPSLSLSSPNRSSHIQHIQKALNLMNLKLSTVLSGITGVIGMKFIRVIIAGEHNPEILAGYRNRQCKHTETQIAKSLEGHYKRDHLFELKQALELHDIYDQKLATCDHELQPLISLLA